MTVVLEANALQAITDECRGKPHVETGGILLGHYTPDRRTAYITKAAGPPSDSRHGRFAFRRGTAGIRCQLEEVWASTGWHYVGEWHFHPHAAPTPSSTDIASMKAVSADPAARCVAPVLLIAGGSAEDLTISAHIMMEGSLRELVKPGEPDPQPARKKSWFFSRIE